MTTTRKPDTDPRRLLAGDVILAKMEGADVPTELYGIGTTFIVIHRGFQAARLGVGNALSDQETARDAYEAVHGEYVAGIRDISDELEVPGTGARDGAAHKEVFTPRGRVGSYIHLSGARAAVAASDVAARALSAGVDPAVCARLSEIGTRLQAATAALELSRGNLRENRADLATARDSWDAAWKQIAAMVRALLPAAEVDAWLPLFHKEKAAGEPTAASTTASTPSSEAATESPTTEAA